MQTNDIDSEYNKYPASARVMTLVWIAFAGGIGSVLRYLLYTRIDQVHTFSFPLGVMVVNIIGSFLMGLLAWSLVTHIQLAAEYRTAILVGLLGGFTTFSAFSHDTLQMLLRGEYVAVVLHIVLSVLLCIMAAGAGLYIAKSF